MIEFLGLGYGLLKDLKDYLVYNEEDKLVGRDWLHKSGLEEKLREDGYTLRWSRPENVETRRLEGYEVMYEVDKLRRVRHRLVDKVGSVLMGKKEQNGG